MGDGKLNLQEADRLAQEVDVLGAQIAIGNLDLKNSNRYAI